MIRDEPFDSVEVSLPESKAESIAKVHERRWGTGFINHDDQN
jgi:hypothetical protein